MGNSLLKHVSKTDSNKKVIAIAKNVKEYQDQYKDANVELFEAELVLPEDRANLINWMHECKYGADTIFHNYPRILKVEGEKPTFDNFKHIMAEIIEQPLYVNSELLEDKLIIPGASIFHSYLKQKGIFRVVKGTFSHMQRCLIEKIAQYNLNIINVDPGVYSDRHIENLQLEGDELSQLTQAKLDPEIVAQLLAYFIVNHKECRTNSVNVYQELSTEKWADLVKGTTPTEPEVYRSIM